MDEDEQCEWFTAELLINKCQDPELFGWLCEMEERGYAKFNGETVTIIAKGRLGPSYWLNPPF